MATIRIRYLTKRPRLNGTVRYYWQPSTELQAAGWAVQRLAEKATGTPGQIEAAAFEEAKRCNADLDRWYQGTGEVPVEDPKHGSVEALITLYKKSAKFNRLADKTKVSYSYALRIINRWAGDSPVIAITPKLVSKYYEATRARTPAKAAAVIRVLRLLMDFARKEDMIVNNPAAKPGIENEAQKGKLWSAEAIAEFVSQADIEGHFSVGTAVYLNSWLGQRKGDIITLLVSDYIYGKLFKVQNKTDANVALPIDQVPHLKARLDAQLAHNKNLPVPSTYLISGKDGQPFKEDWFTHLTAQIRAKAWRRIQAEAAAAGVEIKEGHPLHGFDKLIFKDLRHTAVTRLAEAGATIPQIASISGHSQKNCEAIVDLYNIRTSRMAEEAFRLRVAAEQPQPEKETKHVR